MRAGSLGERWRAEVFADPLLASIKAVSAGLAQHDDWPGLDTLNRLAANSGLTNARGLPLRFVAQTVRRGQLDYERHILETGEVPTRPHNWHDLFNALVWLSFPRSKATLNALQCAALAQHGAPGRRSPLSDAATLFDESGLVLVAPDECLAAALRARRWREAFVTRRAEWAVARCYVFGHALLEKALAPFPAMTGKCLSLCLSPLQDGEAALTAVIDAHVAACWSQGVIRRPADLFPVPVLGIPGLWPANAAPEFYDDTRVFRP